MTEVIFTEKIYEMLKGDDEMRHLGRTILKSANDNIYVIHNGIKQKLVIHKANRSAWRYRKAYEKLVGKIIL